MFQKALTGLAFILYGVSCWEWEKYPFCVEDETQSPRAIVTNELVDGADVCTPHLNWVVDHSYTTWKIENDKHTIKLRPWDPINNVSLTTKINTIAKLQNQFNTQDEVHQTYCFDSFHFHWGIVDDIGSEHTIDNKRFELEIHFVHFSCDFDTVVDALGPTSNHSNIIELEDPYTLAVIGVFADNSDTDNPAFDKIIEALPQVRYPKGTNETVAGSALIYNFNITDLLPDDRNQFYYYQGSLTTPDCNPVVRWHLLKNNIYISEGQLAALRSLKNEELQTESNNYRDVQENKNPVYECTYGTPPDNTDDNNNNDDSKTKKKLEQETILMVIVGCIALIVIIGVCIAFFKCKKEEIKSKKYIQMINETLTDSANDSERM